MTAVCRSGNTNVSIHAPARGATIRSESCLSWSLFQFTLPRGERRWPTKHLPKVKSFNSRSREGSDQIGVQSPTPLLSVSIHAPARGATSALATSALGLPCFNSRSREGSDGESPTLGGTGLSFQFTLPRGERRYRDTEAYGDRRFNSRSREGSDSVLSVHQTDY